MESHTLTLINHAVNAAALLLYVVLVSIMSVFPRSNGDAGVMGALWSNGASWGAVVWTSVVVLLPAGVARWWRAGAPGRRSSSYTSLDGREESCMSLPLLRSMIQEGEDGARLIV